MDIKEIVTIDPEIQFGTPVFAGTRVPLVSLFFHLDKGISIVDFLKDFPSVKEEQCHSALEIAGKLLSSKNLIRLYEDAA